MKTLRLLFILVAVLSFSYLANSQGEFSYDAKIGFFWIAMEDGDTVPGQNGSWSLVPGQGEDGKWQAYVDDITLLPWVNTWFYNGPLVLTNMKKVRMGFWVVRPDPNAPSPIDWVVNWSSDEWPQGQGYPPPMAEPYVLRSAHHHMMVGAPQQGQPGTWIELYYEIPYYNPEYISVDIMGDNIQILPMPMPPPAGSSLLFWWNWATQQNGNVPPPGGIVVHECVAKPTYPIIEYGDAPEGDTAYINPVVIGNFPTCMQVGPPNSYISHGCPSALFFGALVDCEFDGNAGLCPTFGPNLYNMDECGTFPYPIPPTIPPGPLDEGLFKPIPLTLGLLPNQFYGYFPCGAQGTQPLGMACQQAVWGQNVDIWINGVNPNQAGSGYFNLLADWNQDGDWTDVVDCEGTQLSEHVIVDFLIPPMFSGPISQLAPPNFTIGPDGGYVWTRFTLTERPVGQVWDGSGVFYDGETEDYLILVSGTTIPVSNWSVILLVALIAVFTLLYFVRKR